MRRRVETPFRPVFNLCKQKMSKFNKILNMLQLATANGHKFTSWLPIGACCHGNRKVAHTRQFI